NIPDTETIGSLQGTGSVSLGSSPVDPSLSPGHLNTGGNNLDATFDGTIAEVSKMSTLTKIGSGTQTLRGTNTYTGPTTITGGMLSISSDANLGTAPRNRTSGQLVIDSGTLQTTADVKLNRNRGIALGPASGSGGGTVDVAGGTTLTYSGIIANNGGTGGLTK